MRGYYLTIILFCYAASVPLLVPEFLTQAGLGVSQSGNKSL